MKQNPTPTKHTPGPWTVIDAITTKERYHIATDNAAPYASMIAHLHGTDPKHGDKEANARLIAAAPALLAQLQNLVEVCPECGGKGYFLAPLGPPENDFSEPEPCAWCQAARAAIAQAEGGAQ